MVTVEVKCRFYQQMEGIKNAWHQYYRCFSCKEPFNLIAPSGYKRTSRQSYYE